MRTVTMMAMIIGMLFITGIASAQGQVHKFTDPKLLPPKGVVAIEWGKEFNFPFDAHGKIILVGGFVNKLEEKLNEYPEVWMLNWEDKYQMGATCQAGQVIVKKTQLVGCGNKNVIFEYDSTTQPTATHTRTPLPTNTLPPPTPGTIYTTVTPDLRPTWTPGWAPTETPPAFQELTRLEPLTWGWWEYTAIAQWVKLILMIVIGLVVILIAGVNLVNGYYRRKERKRKQNPWL